MTRAADRAVARLTAAVLAVKPLAAELAGPIRVTAAESGDGTRAVLADLLATVARHAGVAGLTLVPDADTGRFGAFEQVISDRLGLAGIAAELVGPEAVSRLRPTDVDRVAAASVAAGFDARYAKRTIAAADGVPLNVYRAGTASEHEPVVLIPACGMPAALIESWLRLLARDRQVVTWESRGLFDASGHDGDFAVDIDAQAADLFTVLDHAGLAGAHVVAQCGGAVIALAAAAARPERIASLSLWHGAYGFAENCPTTKHQHDLIELMTMAASGRATAAAIQSMFYRTALNGTPRELAHLVLYPFANPELFYRYCRVNTGLTGADVERYLDRVKQPVLVVTSRDDVTAAPEGSRRVAAGLPNARLRVEPHGDHIALFRADDALVQVAIDFIADCPRFL
ncbi:alpha/beta fold hydrolase [Nocardia sp. BMG111209]|uniref:alpha/beta fold hydrolase n=1 Tax=Nocardia sp. BMG111209 TaxID=1160137 RepID=UPI00037460AD|nr:alpha/beta hydrolase [Nocardia sp. BMG111209]